MDMQENDGDQLVNNEPKVNDIAEENSSYTDGEKTDSNVQKGAEWDKMYRAIQNSKGDINIYFENREKSCKAGLLKTAAI